MMLILIPKKVFSSQISHIFIKVILPVTVYFWFVHCFNFFVYRTYFESHIIPYEIKSGKLNSFILIEHLFN